MKILITGGTGFLGSHLAEKLILLGHEVTTLDNQFTGCNTIKNANMRLGSITDLKIVDELVKDSDVVFHLAGILGTSETLDMIQKTNEVNINGTVNVLQACTKYSVHVIFSSKPNPPGFLNPYTITKMAAESYCMMYHQMYGLMVTIPRLMYLYGPRQRVFPEVNYRKYIPTFITQALKNKTIEVYGTGRQTIDPLYIDDAVNTMILIMLDITSNKPSLNGKIYDVGTGEGYSVRNIVNKIITLTNSRSKVHHSKMRKGEPDHSVVIADLNTLTETLFYTPSTSLMDGLKKTIPFYEEWLKNKLE
uniref:Putative NADH dehydrogenase n=1 Tax=viral metagenome TaxID=1070528 RepID=A0A6M3JSR6_9ZZZZ